MVAEDLQRYCYCSYLGQVKGAFKKWFEATELIRLFFKSKNDLGFSGCNRRLDDDAGGRCSRVSLTHSLNDQNSGECAGSSRVSPSVMCIDLVYLSSGMIDFEFRSRCYCPLLRA